MKNKKEKVRKEVDNNVENKKTKIKRIFTIKSIPIWCWIILGIICFGILAIFAFKIYLNNKYKIYEDFMCKYGFNLLYDNKSAKGSETVKKDEIAKVTFGVILNEKNIDFATDRMLELEDVTYENKNIAWLDYATYYNAEYLTYEDFSSNATNIDVAMYLVKAIEGILKENIITEEGLVLNTNKEYTEEETEILKKAIAIGIIENTSKSLEGVKLYKGILQEMLYKVAIKYSTLYYKSTYFRYNDDEAKASLVIDEDNMPNNSEIYPYIIDTIDKEIYEIETESMTAQISEKPIYVYNIYGEEYYQSEKNIEGFFDTILNIDYTNITTDRLINSINEYVVYNLDNESDREILDKYINYVKENEIILKGKGVALLPIVYSNGLIHFVRTKITFEVVNSKTTSNLLLWDTDTKYTSRKISVYVDVPIAATYYSKAFRVYNGSSLMKYIVKNDGNVEVQ